MLSGTSTFDSGEQKIPLLPVSVTIELPAPVIGSSASAADNHDHTSGFGEYATTALPFPVVLILLPVSVTIVLPVPDDSWTR